MFRVVLVIACLLLFFLKRTTAAPYWGEDIDNKNESWPRKQIPSTSFLLNWILQLLYRSDFYTLLNYNTNSGVWNVKATPNKEVNDAKPETGGGLKTSNLDDGLVMVRDKENEQSSDKPPLTIIRDYDQDTTTTFPPTKKLSNGNIPIVILTGNSVDKIQEGSTEPLPALSTIRDYDGNGIGVVTMATPSVSEKGSPQQTTTSSGSKPLIPIISAGQIGNSGSGHLQISGASNNPTTSLNMVRFSAEQTTKSSSNAHPPIIRDREDSISTGSNTTPFLVVVRDKEAEDHTASTSKPLTTTAKNSGLAVLGPNDILNMFG